MSLADKIAGVLVDLGYKLRQPGPYRLKRTRAGHHQRSSGAWSWLLLDGNGVEICGSPYAAGDVVRAHRSGRVTLLRLTGGTELEIDGSLPRRAAEKRPKPIAVDMSELRRAWQRLS